MKKVFGVLLCVFCGLNNLFAEDAKTLKTKISEVTVFLDGAQIGRTGTATLSLGSQIFSVEGLSPSLDPSSIQVQGSGEFKVMGVNHRFNYFNKEKASKEEESLTDSTKKLNLLIEDAGLEINLLQERENFLNTNKQIRGNNDNMDAPSLIAISKFYNAELHDIRTDKLKWTRRLQELVQRRNKFQNQLNSIRGKMKERTSEILIEISSSKVLTTQLKVSYLVANAGWKPSYDIRVSSIDKPLELIYKANVFQSTGEDWEAVQLKFSNAEPNLNANLPKLLPYYLRFGQIYRKQVYDTRATSATDFMGIQEKRVDGRVTDADGEPIPYATIQVPNSTQGTYTDESGRFSLHLSPNAYQIVVNAVGYNSISQSVGEGGYFELRMAEQETRLNEVVINMDANVRRLPARELSADTYYYSTNSVPGFLGKFKNKEEKDKKGIYDNTAQVELVENETTVEFVITEPYTIKSSGKPTVIDMKAIEIPAIYEYRTIPKLEESAFLIAQITDWSQYQLMQGQANLYFEHTFIGRSLLDVQFLTDTLDISLGRDKGVIVKRTMTKEFNSKEIIGTEQIAKRGYEIEIRNNKKQAINVVLFDQYPISTYKDLSVDLKESDGAKVSSEIGLLTWKFAITPNGQQKKTFRYHVKYPKGQIINLEGK
jgi:hypothetical protein